MTNNDGLTLEKLLEIKRKLDVLRPKTLNIPNRPIVESIYLTIEKRYTLSWRERLFSWPWRPWQKERVYRIPDPNVYVLNNAIYCHPAVAREIRKVLK